jgi:predicted DCC family thiol-disulfide oxidoreductase YuxK
MIENTDHFWGIQRIRLFVILLCCLLAVWLVFAEFAVPPLIRSAYRGDSISFLNGFINAQAEVPVEFYLEKWTGIAEQVLGGIFVFWLLSFLTTSKSFFRRFVGEATPGTLGAIRMWVCTILLLTASWEDLSSIAVLPLDFHFDFAMGVMKFFHEFPMIAFDRFLTSESSLRAFQILTELLLFLGAIGLGTRIVVPLCAVSVFIFQGILREYSGVWHQNLVPAYVLTVLSFTPCGDGWSIDRLRKVYQGQPVPDAENASPVYGWARYACWVPIAMTYAAAGFSKLRVRGLGWVSATNMRALLYEQTLYPRTGNLSITMHLAPLPDYVFTFLGIVALCGEVFFITVLFSRTARRIMPAVTILMHVGIIFLQNIVFFDLILLLLVFYDFTWVCKRIGRWLNKAGSTQILYDGSCRLCSRSVRILASVDIFHRLEVQDFRRLNLVDFNRKYGLELAPEGLEREMVVRSSGKVYAGFEGYRVIAWALPLFWPLAPFLSLPGVSSFAKFIYSYIAGNRFDLLKCSSSCLADTSIAVQSSEANTMRYSLFFALVVAAVTAVMATVWLNRLEYYPFTSVQMFTSNHGSVVRYYKTLGHRELGQVASIQLEDTIPVFSINSRYEALFDLCFGQADDIALCKKTVSILGSAYNKKVPPAKRLTGLEIQSWVWDFGSSPHDPNHGQMEKSFLGEIPPNGDHQQSALQK